MKILVLGSGAREHAILLALRSEDTGHEIFTAAGNAGIGHDATLVALDANEPAAVVRLTPYPGQVVGWLVGQAASVSWRRSYSNGAR